MKQQLRWQWNEKYRPFKLERGTTYSFMFHSQTLIPSYRAQESQICMIQMLEKYEDMKNKLDSTKQNLEDTTSKISVQQELTDKIMAMKQRIEAYASRKEAVSYLTEHVSMKHQMHVDKLEAVKEESESKTEEESERYKAMKAGLKDHTERVENLKALMKQNEESLRKREEIKAMLEKQVLLGEKRAAEQTRITEAREKLLAMKMRELELQKAKLVRKKREQEEKERATEDFFQHIDKQLEEMESSAGSEKAVPTGAVPKQKRNKSKGKGRNRSKSNTPASVKVMSPEPKAVQIKAKSPKEKAAQSEEKSAQSVTNQTQNQASESKLAKKEDSPLQEEELKKASLKGEDQKGKDCQKKDDLEKKEISNEERIKEDLKIKEETKVELNKAMSPEANKVTITEEQEIKTEEKETACENEDNKDTEIKPISDAKTSKNLEETKCDRKMTEEEVKDMVEKVEGKCKNIRGDIADMAMSEQYLRTKQALLMAKKKEQEMKIAQKMASIRETEVQKMKEKVEHMQVKLCEGYLKILKGFK